MDVQTDVSMDFKPADSTLGLVSTALIADKSRVRVAIRSPRHDVRGIAARIGILALASVFVACASEPRQFDAIDDYVLAGELPVADKILPNDRDSWSALSDRYIIYKTRQQDYLINFRGRCSALLDRRLARADIRYERSLRPRVDTIRGCLIGKIFLLTPDDVVELENLGEPPPPMS